MLKKVEFNLKEKLFTSDKSFKLFISIYNMSHVNEFPLTESFVSIKSKLKSTIASSSFNWLSTNFLD
jgi:hypothetical protein